MSRLEEVRNIIKQGLEISKDNGFEIEVGCGIIQLNHLLDWNKIEKLRLIQYMVDTVDQYVPKEELAPILSMLHEAQYDVEFGKI